MARGATRNHTRTPPPEMHPLKDLKGHKTMGERDTGEPDAREAGGPGGPSKPADHGESFGRDTQKRAHPGGDDNPKPNHNQNLEDFFLSYYNAKFRQNVFTPEKL